MGGMMNGFGGYGGFGAFGWIGLILNLVFTIGLVVGLILLIVWLWRQVTSGSQVGTVASDSGGASASPRDILQIRYARGEITREQYQQMLADLSS